MFILYKQWIKKKLISKSKYKINIKITTKLKQINKKKICNMQATINHSLMFYVQKISF
jgi:hypothetical protein